MLDTTFVIFTILTELRRGVAPSIYGKHSLNSGKHSPRACRFGYTCASEQACWAFPIHPVHPGLSKHGWLYRPKSRLWFCWMPGCPSRKTCMVQKILSIARNQC